MDPYEFYKKMTDIRDMYKNDPEMCHAKMDELMCQVLTKLGYEAGVTVFENIGKWYA